MPLVYLSRMLVFKLGFLYVLTIVANNVQTFEDFIFVVYIISTSNMYVLTTIAYTMYKI